MQTRLLHSKNSLILRHRDQQPAFSPVPSLALEIDPIAAAHGAGAAMTPPDTSPGREETMSNRQPQLGGTIVVTADADNVAPPLASALMDGTTVVVSDQVNDQGNHLGPVVHLAFGSLAACEPAHDVTVDVGSPQTVVARGRFRGGDDFAGDIQVSAVTAESVTGPPVDSVGVIDAASTVPISVDADADRWVVQPKSDCHRTTAVGCGIGYASSHDVADCELSRAYVGMPQPMDEIPVAAPIVAFLIADDGQDQRAPADWLEDFDFAALTQYVGIVGEAAEVETTSKQWVSAIVHGATPTPLGITQTTTAIFDALVDTTEHSGDATSISHVATPDDDRWLVYVVHTRDDVNVEVAMCEASSWVSEQLTVGTNLEPRDWQPHPGEMTYLAEGRLDQARISFDRNQWMVAREDSRALLDNTVTKVSVAAARMEPVQCPIIVELDVCETSDFYAPVNDAGDSVTVVLAVADGQSAEASPLTWTAMPASVNATDANLNLLTDASTPLDCSAVIDASNASHTMVDVFLVAGLDDVQNVGRGELADASAGVVHTNDRRIVEVPGRGIERPRDGNFLSAGTQLIGVSIRDSVPGLGSTIETVAANAATPVLRWSHVMSEICETATVSRPATEAGKAAASQLQVTDSLDESESGIPAVIHVDLAGTAAAIDFRSVYTTDFHGIFSGGCNVGDSPTSPTPTGTREPDDPITPNLDDTIDTTIVSAILAEGVIGDAQWFAGNTPRGTDHGDDPGAVIAELLFDRFSVVGSWVPDDGGDGRTYGNDFSNACNRTFWNGVWHDVDGLGIRDHVERERAVDNVITVDCGFDRITAAAPDNLTFTVRTIAAGIWSMECPTHRDNARVDTIDLPAESRTVITQEPEDPIPAAGEVADDRQDVGGPTDPNDTDSGATGGHTAPNVIRLDSVTNVSVDEAPPVMGAIDVTVVGACVDDPLPTHSDGATCTTVNGADVTDSIAGLLHGDDVVTLAAIDLAGDLAVFAEGTGNTIGVLESALLADDWNPAVLEFAFGELRSVGNGIGGEQMAIQGEGVPRGAIRAIHDGHADPPPSGSPSYRFPMNVVVHATSDR